MRDWCHAWFAVKICTLYEQVMHTYIGFSNRGGGGGGAPAPPHPLSFCSMHGLLSRTSRRPEELRQSHECASFQFCKSITQAKC